MKKKLLILLFLCAPVLSFIGPFPPGGSSSSGGGSGSVTSVGMSVPSFLSVAGSPITSSGTLAVNYSGTALPIANGGTGETSASSAINALLPSQGGNNGEYLTTNGTVASWAAVTVAAAGSDTQFQYNNGGSFGGTAYLTYNDANGAIDFSPTGSLSGDYAIGIDLSGMTASTGGIGIFGSSLNAANGPFIYSTPSFGALSSSETFHRFSPSATSMTAGNYLMNFYMTISATSSAKSLGLYDSALGVYGIFNSASGGTSGSGQGIAAYGENSNYAIGGNFAGITPNGSSPQSYGVRAYATGENSAQQVGGYFRIYTVQASASETASPGVSAGLIADNGNTTNAVFVGLDNGSGNTVFQIKDGGNTVAKAMAYTPTAVELTADNQSLTLTNASHVRLTSDNTTPGDRTFVLGDGGDDGQKLLLEWNEAVASGAGELADSGNANLSAAWTPDIGDTLSLVWNNGASEWRETSRSDNSP